MCVCVPTFNLIKAHLFQLAVAISSVRDYSKMIMLFKRFPLSALSLVSTMAGL